MSHTFDSVLVANRGEIAVRVLRSARALGYRTIAVYSEADADAPHVAMADEAVCIGAPAVGESYLNAQKVLDAALRTGAQAIHPGYGFLSENGDFARACLDAGIVFVGPSAEAIDLMGNKAAAKRRMLDAGVPCIPGYQSQDQSDDALRSAASEIGVPLMVKAAAGGGGRGMRLVEDLDDLHTALADARSEAANAFGSGELILEKAVLRCRHVEVQVFGDSQGNVVFLGERDCSVQRRHQKVVEEAPCVVMTAELRRAMGDAAVAAAKSIHYVGAGTVEFLLDTEGSFYFLEMNTRLQVEHPVTELVTHLDLVEMQLRVAQGHTLAIEQPEVVLDGHAIEVRLYAEDTAKDFLPASGVVATWVPPEGEGIRVDHSLQSGQAVTPFYDPMIAKIIAWGEDRETARRRLIRALANTVVLGVTTNRQFLLDVLNKDSFIAGDATTAFIPQEFPSGHQLAVPTEQHYCLAAWLLFLQGDAVSRGARVCDDDGLAGYAGFSRISSTYAFDQGETQREVTVAAQGEAQFDVVLDGAHFCLALLDMPSDDTMRVAIDGHQSTLAYSFGDAGCVEILWRGQSGLFLNALAFNAAAKPGSGSGEVYAPMHGSVLAVAVAAGQRVSAGDELAIIEAMKMEHRLHAEVDGTVQVLHVSPGQQVAAGTLIMQIEVESEAEA